MGPPSGVYFIEHIHDRNRVGFAKDNDGDDVAISGADSGKYHGHKWEIEKLQDGSYHIRSQHFRDHASYKIADTGDRGEVLSISTGDPKRWRITISNDPGVYRISDWDDTLCWSLKKENNKETLTLEKYTQNDRQHWKILGEGQASPSVHLFDIPSLWKCPSPSSRFTGRKDILAKMHKYFSSDLGKRHIFVLHGPGGVGKRQISLKFIEECQVDTKASRFSSVFFVDAITKESTASDFRNIARAKGLTASPEVALQWLSRQDDEWLLVINNADDPSVDLQSYIPGGSFGNIIITSRNSETRTLASDPQSNSNVSGLTPDDAIDLFFKTAGMKDEQSNETKMSATKIVEELGHLPLAIVQAGGYISQSGCGLDRYVEMYRERRAGMMEEYRDEELKIDDRERTAYTTWSINFEKLSTRATTFMNICAFFYHDWISAIIFRDAAYNVGTRKFRCSQESNARKIATEFLSSFLSEEGYWDTSEFVAVTSEIRSYSLINLDERNDTYSIHPLVHDWTRRKLSNDTTIHECSQFILSLSVDINFTPYEHRFRQIILPHLDASLWDGTPIDPDVAAWLWRPYHESGRLSEAEKLIVLATDKRKQILGEDDLDTIKSTIDLGSTYWALGKFKEAAEVSVRVMETCKRVLGEEDPTTLASKSNLALTYHDMGRLNEAVELGLRAMMERERTQGQSQFGALAAMSNLAMMYTSQGRLEESEALSIRVLETSKRCLGEDHPHTLMRTNNLASTYWQQGRWKESEELYAQAVEKTKRVFGEDHPLTLANQSNLAASYNSLGRWKESEELGLRVVKKQKRVLGEDHPDTLSALANLASTYHGQDRWEASEKLGVRVVETNKRILGENHPTTLASMGNLAHTYRCQGRLKEAEELALQVLEARRRVLGDDHRDTLHNMGDMMMTYASQGRWKEAEVLGKQAVEVSKRVLGEKDSYTRGLIHHMELIVNRQTMWGTVKMLVTRPWSFKIVLHTHH